MPARAWSVAQKLVHGFLARIYVLARIAVRHATLTARAGDAVANARSQMHFAYAAKQGVLGLGAPLAQRPMRYGDQGNYQSNDQKNQANEYEYILQTEKLSELPQGFHQMIDILPLGCGNLTK